MFTENGTDTVEYWNVLESIPEVDEIFEQSKRRPQLLYKHSNRCGTCLFTKSEIENSSDDILKHSEMHFIDVISCRKVSDYIAEKLDIWHESPQAILLKNGKVVWHASHSAIKSTKILDKLS